MNFQLFRCEFNDSFIMYVKFILHEHFIMQGRNSAHDDRHDRSCFIVLWLGGTRVAIRTPKKTHTCSDTNGFSLDINLKSLNVCICMCVCALVSEQAVTRDTDRERKRERERERERESARMLGVGCSPDAAAVPGLAAAGVPRLAAAAPVCM